MERATTPPFVVNFDDADSPADVLDGLTLGPFLAGAQPFARSVSITRLRDGASLLPPGLHATRVAVDNFRRTELTFGDGWTLQSTRRRDRSAYVTVTGASQELVDRVLRAAVDGAEEEIPPDEDKLPIRFWHGSSRGPYRTSRAVHAPEWADIRANYASTVARAIDELLAVDPAAMRGRVLLLHGPPGTGKTTLLRALVRAWREWCSFEYVLDPERLLNEPQYLLQVSLGNDDDDSDGWRLLVLEDCDELIRSDAKSQTGQAVSRLLNLSDGMLGEGLRVLLCITTNEDIARLHPAISRPGRCLAQLHIGPLPYAEAAAWLGSSAGVGRDGCTLAELFSRRDATGQIAVTEPDTHPGQYV